MKRENGDSKSQLTVDFDGVPIDVVFADDLSPESNILGTLADLLIDQHFREKERAETPPAM